MIAVATAAGASAASSGLYTGHTNHGLKITVQVKKGKVVKVDYVASYGSCGKFTGSDKVHLAIRHNRFAATVHPNSETVDKLTGTFKGKGVSGTVTSVVMTGGIHPQTCRSGRLTFRAKRYAQLTSSRGSIAVAAIDHEGEQGSEGKMIGELGSQR